MTIRGTRFWLVGSIAALAAIGLLGMKLTFWSGPGLDITVAGSEAKVESTFLGEYQLGITRLQIQGDDDHSPLVDLRDPQGRIPNVFALRAGMNQIDHSGGAVAQFVLDDGESYALTVCGNNGWGSIRCSSKRFRLASH